MTKDLLCAGRWLSKKPLFALAVVSILALGIGVNTAIFSVVDAMLLRPHPYPGASHLVRLQETSKRRASLGTPSSDVLRWRDRTDLFERVLAYRRDLLTLTGTGDPDQMWVTRTSPGLFSLLGARAERGRTLLAADEQGGGDESRRDHQPAVEASVSWRFQHHWEDAYPWRRGLYHCGSYARGLRVS